MRSPLSYLAPNRFEVVGVGFASVIIVLIGNAKDLLHHYGLADSTAVVSSHIGSSFGSGLSRLDSFSLTQSVVTFGVWGIIGLLTLSILQAIARVSSEVSFQKQVGSRRYIHPSNFNRQGYWGLIATNAAISFGLLVLLVALLLFYFLEILHASFTWNRHLLQHTSVTEVAYMLIGLVLVYLGTLALYTCLKLVVLHHWASRE